MNQQRILMPNSFRNNFRKTNKTLIPNSLKSKVNPLQNPLNHLNQKAVPLMILPTLKSKTTCKLEELTQLHETINSSKERSLLVTLLI